MTETPSELSTAELASQVAAFRDCFSRLNREVQKAIVGHDELISDALVAMFSQGHVLMEGVPGLGKTFLVKVLSQVLGLSFGRVQCTPDLMPADVLGTHIVGEDETGRRAFRFEKGPVFNNLLLVDEINRATPKTQAALLEVMQEHAVTAGGEHMPVPEPFFVLATQNPLEMEGTYPLPEAQLDRFFFKLHVPFPKVDELAEISRRTTHFEQPQLEVALGGDEFVQYQRLLSHVPVADPLTRYAASLVLATHPDQDVADERVKRYVSYGASPRGMQALIRGARAYCLIEGRTAVAVEDIRRVAKPVLRHRVILNFEGEAEQVDVDELIEGVLNNVATPAQGAA
ncbi:MAG: MoxR family ATPase [Planctomycetota bacterium]|nr:MAG: MoxR family ATPase [Planctomycetota bacterium]REJ91820.1 MAG: MoxR family ATPase [Planctomycetota bacterium]REK26015.1 MAG: MoxR family ATPase [Planctomycetota bacterium]REK46992.1 MAG: MoxR family ATPase [Planctomycetota bacterium]